MYILKKAANNGFEEGVKDGNEDKKNGKSVKFKKINLNEVKSKVYDISYINGYNKVNSYKYFYKKNNLQ